MPDAAVNRAALGRIEHASRARSGITGARLPELELDPGQRRGPGDVDLDPRDCNRHIVGRPQLAASLDHALCTCVEITVLEQELAHLFDAHARTLHPVTAEHDRVALVDFDTVGEGLDRFPDSDRPGQTVFQRMVDRFLRLDDAKTYLLGRPRVVL